MIDTGGASMINIPDASFIDTKEYRRFVEFCQATKESNYIGLCYGPPGVGKTKSGKRYANWEFQEIYLKQGLHKFLAPAEVRFYDTLFFTPPVVHSPRDLMKGVASLRKWLSIFIIHSYNEEELSQTKLNDDNTKLIIVDEADRLSIQGLEYLRSIYDEENICVILMGMPGMEKRLSRYPQLYSRVGFVHEFRALLADEVKFIVRNKWNNQTVELSEEDTIDSDALTALIHISRGNFRLLKRLTMQVERLMQINGLTRITKELVQAAREILIIGIT